MSDRTAARRVRTRLHVPDAHPPGLVDAEALDVGVEGSHRDLRASPPAAAIAPYLHACRCGPTGNRACARRPLHAGERAVRRVVGQAWCTAFESMSSTRIVVTPRFSADVVVGLLVEEPSGRRARATNRPRGFHLPHHLGGEASGGDLFGRQRIVDLQRLGTLVASAEAHSCNSRHQENFFHFLRFLTYHLFANFR